MNEDTVRTYWGGVISWITGWTPAWLDPYVTWGAAVFFGACVLAAFVAPLVSLMRTGAKAMLALERHRIRTTYERKLRSGAISLDEFKSIIAAKVAGGLSENQLSAYFYMWESVNSLPATAAVSQLSLAATADPDPLIDSEREAFVQAARSADKKERDALASLIQGKADLAFNLLTEAADSTPDSAAKRYRRFATLVQATWPELALRAFEKSARADANHAGAHFALGMCHRSLYKKHRRRDHLARAAEEFAHVISLVSGDNPALEADALTERGECLRLLRDADDEALSCHVRALELKKSLPKGAKPSRNHHGIGQILARRGRFADALNQFTLAAALEAKLNNRSAELANVSAAGVQNRRLGRLVQARRQHQYVLRRQSAAGSGNARLSEMTNLGIVLRLQGDFTGARKVHGEAISICQRLNDSQAELVQLNCLGDVALAEGHLDEAERLFAQVRSAAPAEDSLIARVQDDKLGVIARHRGHFTKAESIHRASLADATPDRRPRIELNLAWVLALQGSASARDLAVVARKAFERQGQQLEVAESRLVLALTLYNVRNFDQANAHIKAAMEIYRSAGARKMQADAHRIFERWRRSALRARAPLKAKPA